MWLLQGQTNYFQLETSPPCSGDCGNVAEMESGSLSDHEEQKAHQFVLGMQMKEQCP